MRGHRILVVDDETIRSLLRDMLTANGHEVETAGAAAEALKAAEFELVVTDLMLPDGDGLEVLRMARAFPSRARSWSCTAAASGRRARGTARAAVSRSLCRSALGVSRSPSGDEG